MTHHARHIVAALINAPHAHGAPSQGSMRRIQSNTWPTMGQSSTNGGVILISFNSMNWKMTSTLALSSIKGGI
jgi:hypothetical protein